MTAISDASRKIRVCVFAGSGAGAQQSYRAAATALGRELAARDMDLVFGGGDTGLMGAVSAAITEAGGHAIGVIPEHLISREAAHSPVADLRVVATMHERKALMAELADAFVALPGGIGTAEELLEVFTWLQLGIHAKPIGLVDVADYYAPLLDFLAGAVREGFLSETQYASLIPAGDPAELLDRLALGDARGCGEARGIPEQ